MNLHPESIPRVACVLGLALAAACTPLPSVEDNPQDTRRDGGVEDAAASGGSDRDTGMIDPRPAAESCERDGELRCLGGGRLRERCEAGRWRSTDACAEGEVCAAKDSVPGQCSPVIDACRGNAASMVCDAAGTMYRCGASGVVESSEMCSSARHCQLGLAGRACATCLPGEFRCSGDALEVCDTDAREFRMAEACPAGTCDAEQGMCRGVACPEQRAICQGDVLKICARGDTEFSEAARCEPGLCNAAAARCDACLPGTKVCEGETAVTCSDDGSQRERRDCAEDQVHCVGAGQCVQCGRDADCATVNPCQTAYCDLVRGVCAMEPRPAGTACPEGMCSADGECVGCLADADCPAGGACEVRACDRATQRCVLKPAAKGTRCGEGVCDANGACVGCVDDDACPAVGECQVKHCDAATKTCEPKAAPTGETCTGSFGEGSCDDGRCVQCRVDGDCGSAGECEQTFCRTSDDSCQRRPLAAGAACGGGKVCDGGGECVQCTSDLHCGANASCRDHACSCKAGYVANPSGKGCNFDECVREDDNRCGAFPDSGNTCTNTVDGYDCRCGAPWKLGADQCFQGGGANDVRTVPNGATWNVWPDFGIACMNAFDANTPCNPAGQLTWLNVCGLPDTNPADCSGLQATGSDLGTVSVKRVSHAGALQDYGNPNGQGDERVLIPAAGDVILVQTLGPLYLMRIRSVDAAAMTYEWAAVWRDTCWRTGGLSCTSACGCAGGN